MTVGEPDIVGLGGEIFGCDHHDELDHGRIAESGVGPAADRHEELLGSDPVVGDQDAFDGALALVRANELPEPLLFETV